MKSRRRYLVAIGTVGLTCVAGCSGDSDGDGTSDEDNGGNGTSSYDVFIEYETTVGTEPEQIPADIRETHQGAENPDGEREEGHTWVVVEIYVVEGELSMEDIWFHSRVETDDRLHELDHASDELGDGIQSRGSIQEGGYGIALYQIPEDSEFVAWNLDELPQDIRMERR